MKINFKNSKYLYLLLLSILTSSLSWASTDADYLAQLKIDSIQIEYDGAQEKNDNYVSAIAKVANPSDAIAYEIVVEAKFFDAQRKLIDVVTRQIPRVTIPAGKDAFIKISENTSKSKVSYANAEMRVISAEFKRSKSLLGELFASWGPMLLLIGVWIFVMRRYNGYQKRVLDLMGAQNELLTKQVIAVEKLAQADAAERVKD